MRRNRRRDICFCPNCGAILNDQYGFDPDLSVWTCAECGQQLYGDDIEATMDQFDGVVWYCNVCNAILNKQDGFRDDCGTWNCSECGYTNRISEEEILGYEGRKTQEIDESSEPEDTQEEEHIFRCPHCDHELNDQLWLDESEDEYTCSWCDTELYKDEDEYKILYKCPSCGATLKDQWGFSAGDCWICDECGSQLYENDGRYCSTFPDEDDNIEDDNDDYEADEDEDADFSHAEVSSTNSYASPREPNKTILDTPHKKKRIRRKAKLVLSVIMILVFFVGAGYYEFTKLVPVPCSSASLVGEEYQTVMKRFTKAGFSFVSAHEIADLKLTEKSSENRVTEIKIGWISSFEDDLKIPSNFPVTVTYHSLKLISPPMSSKEVKGTNYQEVKRAFESAGFININIEIKYDIITGWLMDEGDVESVVIGERKKYTLDDKFRPDEEITITYHSSRKNKPD